MPQLNGADYTFELVSNDNSNSISNCRRGKEEIQIC